MANLKALGQFISGLRGDGLFGAGIMGITSYQQDQTDALKRAFGLFQAQPDDKHVRATFKSSLMGAHVVSLITDDELRQCEAWLEKD